MTSSHSMTQRVWHYTDASAAIGILTHGRLWATSMAHLNDSAEIEYGIKELFRFVEQGQLGLKSDDAKWIDMMARAAFVHRQYWERLFVACASLDGDSASQWSSYGHTSGYALSFEVRSDEQWSAWGPTDSPVDDEYGHESIHRATFGGTWQEVAYAPTEHLALARELSETMLKSKPLFEADMDRVTFLCIDLVLRFAAKCKHQSFANEREVRCVVNEPSEGARVKFRGGPFGVTPYVEIAPRVAGVQDWSGRAPLEIDEVLVGPSGHISSAQTGIQRLARSVCPNDVRVGKSRSPFRQP